MTEAEDDIPEDQMLAAELAMGLLEGEELTRARQRLASDSAFAQEVARWEAELVTLTDTLDPQTPRPGVKAALMNRLFADAPRPGFWQRLWLWQAVAFGALAVAAFLILVDPARRDAPTGPLYTAEIVSAEGDFRVVAVVDKTTNEVFLTRTAGEPPAGRILQVWAHGPDAPAMSVGLWPEGDSVRLDLPPTIAAVQGVLTLGVSEEPPGGSVTGSPSGRVFGTVDIPNVQDG